MLILLVEDNEAFRYICSRMLTSWGFEVVQAGDGVEALGCLDEVRPDLILTDLMMPRLDGIGLIRRVREIPGLEAVPVVMVTAADSDDLVSEARHAGARHILAKPVDFDDLLRQITRYL